MRNALLEQQWSERWQDIYLLTAEDIVEQEKLNLSTRASKRVLNGEFSATHIGCAYEARQGRFQLLLPVLECEVIATDTTVECLAQFIAKQLKKGRLSANFKVFAFEGVGKGAIAFA